MFRTFWFILTATTLVSTASIETSKDPLVVQLNKLQESDKEDFLVFFLAESLASNQTVFDSLSKEEQEAIPYNLGIDEDKIKQFQSMNIPKSSTDLLLDWTKNTFSLQETEILILATERLCCSPDGSFCVTIPDVNSSCCPW